MKSTSEKNYNDIVSISIYPSIGVARVGNSETDYVIGPEIPGTIPTDADGFRDKSGAIKRQAARFRVFGKDKNGKVICELNADNAEISWTAHLANKKSSWYYFDQALDITASAGTFSVDSPGIASIRRNHAYPGNRSELTIDPGSRNIKGKNKNSQGKDKEYAFDTGKFVKKAVYLGELRTDEKGNLLVLGGLGKSASYTKQKPTTFANNEGWHDDISDGPVDVSVKLKSDGRKLVASDAWVVVAPPDYAPGVQAIITGYDLVYEAAVKMDPQLAPGKVVFYEHIYPILRNLTLHQWVNAGMAIDFGWGSSDFTDEIFQKVFGNPSVDYRAYREALFQKFRNPAAPYLQATAIPQVYGDAVSMSLTTTNPAEWMPLLDIQYEWLSRWAAGDFTTGKLTVLPKWEDMTPQDRADGLTRANLENTIGGPFHPGCEFTWPLRNSIVYDRPFRIKRRQQPEPDYGNQLTSGIALSAGGPLDGSEPGGLSRWMACPWQTDTASCLSAYKPFSGEYLPTFWPARVPNDVVTEDDYNIIMTSENMNDRMAAFAAGRRLKWLREIVYTTKNPASRLTVDKSITLQHFVDQWHKAGIVLSKPGPKTGPFPPRIFVESGRTVTHVNDKAPIAMTFFDYVKKHFEA